MLKNRVITALAAGVCAAGATTASAQVAALQNGSFEDPSLCTPTRPAGFRPYNGAVWHSSTAPSALPLPMGIVPRTGTGMVKLGTGVDFSGWETEDKYIPAPGDILICFDPVAQQMAPFNWPAYTFAPEYDADPTNEFLCGDVPHDPDPVNLAAGEPITVCAWYLIPAAEPLVGTMAGIKIAFKKDFINNPGQFGNYRTFEILNIDGTVPGGVHTNGQWTEYCVTFNQEDFQDPSECDPPDHNTTQYMSVMVMHFAGSGMTANSGSIYWDDFSVTQGGGEPTDCEVADFDNSGTVDATDIFVFLDAWFAQNGMSGPNLSADVDGSGNVDATDIFVYLDKWFAQNGMTC